MVLNMPIQTGAEALAEALAKLYVGEPKRKLEVLLRLTCHNGWSVSPDLLRSMELVVANDKGFIPLMLAIKATKAEITDTLAYDRAARGEESLYIQTRGELYSTVFSRSYVNPREKYLPAEAMPRIVLSCIWDTKEQWFDRVCYAQYSEDGGQLLVLCTDQDYATGLVSKFGGITDPLGSELGSAWYWKAPASKELYEALVDHLKRT